MRSVLVALSLSFAAAATPRKPPPPPPPDRWADFDFDFDIDVPDVQVEVPEISVDLPDLSELASLSALSALEFPEMKSSQMMARNRDRRRDRDQQDEDDDDRDADQQVDSEDDHGAKVRVYKLSPQQRIHLPRVGRLPEMDEDELDERRATGQARGRGSATLQVRGPITFQLRAQTGEVEIVSTDKQQVSVSLSDAPAGEVALYAFGDRVEASFGGRRTLRRGKLRVELPKNSKLDFSSMSGDLVARQLAEVRVRTMSGDVKLLSVGKTDVQTISGDVSIEGSGTPVRLHTVSGHGIIVTNGAAPQIEFQSASGNLDWSGTCARDCHVSAETVSGELHLLVDPKSSFELSYTSHSGELRDELNLDVKRAPRRKHGMASGWLEASFGRGEGVIEADAFSGNLIVKKK